MAKTTKPKVTVREVPAATPAPATTPAPEVPYLELPDFKMPIAELPPEMQEMVTIYVQWQAEFKTAQQAIAEAERALVTSRRQVFLYEAAMKCLADELIARGKVLKASISETTESPSTAS